MEARGVATNSSSVCSPMWLAVESKLGSADLARPTDFLPVGCAQPSTRRPDTRRTISSPSSLLQSMGRRFIDFSVVYFSFLPFLIPLCFSERLSFVFFSFFFLCPFSHVMHHDGPRPSFQLSLLQASLGGLHCQHYHGKIYRQPHGYEVRNPICLIFDFVCLFDVALFILGKSMGMFLRSESPRGFFSR